MPEIRMHTRDGGTHHVEVAPGPAGNAEAGQIHVGAHGSEYVPLVATPAQARELAAALLRAADEAEAQARDTYETVKAGELRRGDVRTGERTITVDRVRTDGDTVHVTWTSDVGRQWTQSYATDTDISLRRRA
ncbi:hypothetical protein J7I98_21360 [Streptomyces sp. ISL-98]|uniref:hypothetical protein n=1 Tax=Streptomyces sp. ISL-98 TaxID=2819192 RepID=UPI001BEC4F2E|nr:hypothetical protein [Streptomyces sp. ISL-98]MBT2508391.1 hypothetical protein [Streptomyces sp. ISL-98]